MKVASLLCILLLFGCVTTDVCTVKKPQQVEVLLSIQGVDAVQVDGGDTIGRHMEVVNREGELSHLSFTIKDKVYFKLFSGIGIGDVTSFWNDICVIYNKTKIRDLNLYINSPGGDAFSGMAFADEIERAQKLGFKVTAHSSGIIASAAVPVFAVCDVRIAAPGTIFMVHEAALWKWPGRETASQIRSQNELMYLLRNRYIGKLVANSKLSKSKWEELEGKTTWFSAEKAKEWGLVDKIE